MSLHSKTILRTAALLAGVITLLGLFWFAAHFRGSMPPSPWPAHTEQVNPAENAYSLTQDPVEEPQIFHELLEAPFGEHARMFREDEITIDRALRESAQMRAEVDALPRFVIRGGDVLQALSFWRHRTVSVLVQADGERATAEARALWRHSVDTVEHCSSLVACTLSVVMCEHAMLAAESVLARFDASEVPELNALRSEVQGAFRPRPSLESAVRDEYHFARDAIETTSCFSFDRIQTEAIFRDYYEAMHAYAEGVARLDDPSSTEGRALAADVEPFRAGPLEEFSSFYNLCGGTLAATLWVDLWEQVESHREKFTDLERRQRALP